MDIPYKVQSDSRAPEVNTQDQDLTSRLQGYPSKQGEETSVGLQQLHGEHLIKEFTQALIEEKVGDIDPAHKVARIRRDNTTPDSAPTTFNKSPREKGSF